MAEVIAKKPVSTFLTISVRDAAKGLIVSIITAVFTAAYKAFEAGELDLSAKTLHTIGMVALGAGLSYLTKNFFDGPKTA